MATTIHASIHPSAPYHPVCDVLPGSGQHTNDSTLVTCKKCLRRLGEAMPRVSAYNIVTQWEAQAAAARVDADPDVQYARQQLTDTLNGIKRLLERAGEDVDHAVAQLAYADTS